MILGGDESRSPARPGDELSLGDLPTCPVRVAKVANLARRHEGIQRTEGLLDRRKRVRSMELVQIDPVRAQSVQGSLNSADDVPARAPGAPVGTAGATHVHSELGCHHNVLPPRSQRPAQELLAQPGGLAVRVSGVEKGDPGIDRGIDDSRCAVGRLGRRAGTAQVVTSQTHNGDGQAGVAKSAYIHGDETTTSQAGARAGR